MNRRISGTKTILAASLLCLLVAPLAVARAGSSSGGPVATDTASLKKQVQTLKKQVRKVKKQLGTLARQQGPQGSQGPQGTQGPQGSQGPQGGQGATGAAATCQGNGSGDTMVSAGAVCIDRYEVSVWSSPTGGTQYGTTSDDYPCSDIGQGCKAGTASAIYARSVPGVTPSSFISYFQAQQALANVGKRLPSNAEWQQAVAGTPDPGATPGAQDCNTNSAGAVATGSRANCVSNFGANDMVGNVDEWVADWVPESTACPNWGTLPATFSSDDKMCLAGASTVAGPGVLLRGGTFSDSTVAGPLKVDAINAPYNTGPLFGFRGAR